MTKAAIELADDAQPLAIGKVFILSIDIFNIFVCSFEFIIDFSIFLSLSMIFLILGVISDGLSFILRVIISSVIFGFFSFSNSSIVTFVSV